MTSSQKENKTEQNQKTKESNYFYVGYSTSQIYPPFCKSNSICVMGFLHIFV